MRTATKRKAEEYTRYSGDDPGALAAEVERALKLYRRGNDRRLLAVIEFFEGELMLIAKALRAYKPAKNEK